MPVQPPDIGKRIRAARCYAGYSLGGMAKKLEIGRNSQIAIERQDPERKDRRPRESELRQLAATCRLPLEFFYADFTRLKEISPSDAGGRFQQELEDDDPPSQQQESDTG
jgi:transcriptional regulator with XRE-family HTH domain